jgi:hypothetical protein
VAAAHARAVCQIAHHISLSFPRLLAKRPKTKRTDLSRKSQSLAPSTQHPVHRLR